MRASPNFDPSDHHREEVQLEPNAVPQTTGDRGAGPKIRPCTSACLYAAPDHLPRVAYHVVSPKGHAAANQREPALFSESYNL